MKQHLSETYIQMFVQLFKGAISEHVTTFKTAQL